MKPTAPRAGALRGVAVLVTRPSDEAIPWKRRIQALGGTAICQPGIELGPATLDAPDLERLRRISPRDWLIFTSPAAVRYALPLIDSGQLPAQAGFWAVGRRTAADLEHALGVRVRAPGAGAGSDALLAEPPFARVGGRRILILGARGGRTLLQQTLKRRGAEVYCIHVYRRFSPTLRAAALAQLKSHYRQLISTATSVEILTTITELLAGRLPAPLRERPLVVISERIAAVAAELGYRQVAVSADPGPDSVIQAVADLASAASRPAR